MRARFYFDHHPPIEGEVTYSPRKAGDAYYVTRKDRRDFRIKNFAYMEVLSDAKEDTTVQALPTVD